MDDDKWVRETWRKEQGSECFRLANELTTTEEI